MTSSSRPRLDVVAPISGVTTEQRMQPVGERRTLVEDDGDDAATETEPKAIRVTRKGEEPFFLPIYADQRYTFGRTSDATVVFGDRTISRSHGQLAYRGDGTWVYRDLGSANGSFLSDLPEYDGPVESARRLTPGRDFVVQVGQSVVLGNRAGRITFLRELPVEEQTNPGPRRKSEASLRLERALRLNARHTMPVFLLGPKGSGKTHLARKLHEASGQRGPFVLVNCARLSTDIAALHAELLGSRRGAFTGAHVDRRGALHHAHNGTLFLDEVESLPPAAQNFLLDVLEGTGNFAPLGAPADLEVPRPMFRLICASKVALDDSSLRPDLRDRIAMGAVILLPTLEERRKDIPALVERFCEHLRRERSLEVIFDPMALALLQKRAWPGHVRELEGVVKVVAELEAARACDDIPAEPLSGIDGAPPRRTQELPAVGDNRPQRVFISQGAVQELLESRDVAYGRTRAPVIASTPPLAAESVGAAPAYRKRTEDLSRDDIVRALAAAGGNKTQAARTLGVAYNTFKKRSKEFGVWDESDGD